MWLLLRCGSLLVDPEFSPQVVSADVSLPEVLDDGPPGLLPVGQRSLPLGRPGLALGLRMMNVSQDIETPR